MSSGKNASAFNCKKLKSGPGTNLPAFADAAAAPDPADPINDLVGGGFAAAKCDDNVETSANETS